MISPWESSCGTCQPSPKGRAEGATVGHGDWSALRKSRPSQGTCDEALRPAWPIWMPIGFLGLLLLISGPSVLIAYSKLRQRNLGPILDANGWAVNTLTRVNIPLGRSLTG